MDQLAERAADLALAERLASGCEQTTAEFVRTNMPWMLQVATRILHDRSAAEDAVQEAFASAFANIGKFEHKSALKTWLHRIVVNQCLMQLRRSKRQAEENLDDLMPFFDQTGCRVEVLWQNLLSADEVLDQIQLRDAVNGAIGKLPETLRVVLVLRDIEGFTTAEVAEQLEMTVSNVKVRLHRARSALKKLLEPVLEGHL